MNRRDRGERREFERESYQNSQRPLRSLRFRKVALEPCGELVGGADARVSRGWLQNGVEAVHTCHRINGVRFIVQAHLGFGPLLAKVAHSDMSTKEQEQLQEPINTVVARIDERTKALAASVESIKLRLDWKYVTQHEFRPVKMLVYGAVALTLTGLLTAIIALVTKT